jgi:hypothetical protein
VSPGNPRFVRLLTEIVHRDWSGTVTGRWPAGSIVRVTAETDHYWVGPPDVYKDEGVLLPEEIDERYIFLSNN